MASSDRVLYIGTTNGVFSATPNGDGDVTAKPLGLQGKGAIRGMLVDCDDPRRVYVATANDGVHVSADGGETWRAANEGVIYKEAWSLAQHPKTGELYLGTGPAAVFKSTDRGETWRHCEHLHSLEETLFWTFPRPPHIAHVKNLTVRLDDPSYVYGAIEEGWIIRSTDGGKTWVTLKQGVDFDSHAVYVMPDNPDVVVAVTGQGVFKSTNGGDTFRDANQGLVGRYMAPLAMNLQRPQVLMVAAAEAPPPFWRGPRGANTTFYRSEDQGESWQRLTQGLPELIQPAPRATAADAADPNTFAYGMATMGGPQGPSGSVWLTTNAGETIQPIVQGLPPVGTLAIAHR